ncbi:DUF4232 domain-containing protein [Mycolicibacterium moriokaense]|nr:DUF4232 domain-containing protein [Mycolicibacterium moriokaense]
MTMLSRHTWVAIAAIAVGTVAVPAPAHADGPPPCTDGQVQVSDGGRQAAMGHREVDLLFSLAPGAADCTLTGYPGVDSGAGGPLIHAARTLSGYMGGLRDTDVPPTVTVTATTPGRAVVEGVAVDKHDPNLPCPTYTGLLVTPPDTTAAVTVPVTIDTCELQVHPIESTGDGSYHQHDETAQYTMDISYPLDYPDVQAVSEFVNADRGYFLDWIARFGHNGPNRQFSYDVTGTTYRSAQHATTSLVLTLENDTGAAHQAHPATSYSAFNYDLTARRPITLDTLLRPGADLVSALGPRMAALYDRPTNTLLPSDFRNFALTDDAVIFFFGEGQLAAADNSGPRQMSVPRSELAPLLA